MHGRVVRRCRNLQLPAFCFLILILAPSFITQTEAEKAAEISKSIERQNELARLARSKEMLKYMNASVSPCQDFYAYSCGNWAKYRVQTKQHEIENKIEHDLINLLEEQVTLNDGVNGRKVKDFYKSCKTALANGQKQQTFHSEVIKNHGGFPAAPGSNWAQYNANYDWAQVVGRLRHEFSMDILIGVEIVINPNNTNGNTIYLTEPSTIIPKELCSAEGTRQMETHRQEYEQLEADVATNLENWLSLSKEEAKKIASNILLFEFELCTAMRVPESMPKDQTNHSQPQLRRSLYELTHYFNDSIDFYKFISNSYGMNYANPVAVRTERYFRHLIHTISIHDKSALANYIMYRALTMLSFPLQDNKQKRPKYCARLARKYFPKVIGYMYYRKFANVAGKAALEQIFEKLKIAFELSLKQPWLEDGTRRLGLAKLNEISLHFPNYVEKPNLNNLPIDVNNFWQNLKEVMPQVQQAERLRALDMENTKPDDEVESFEPKLKYHSVFKRIDVGWALLQPAFYHEVYPQSMLYAMLGQMLAYQLVSAFDDNGWTSDLWNYANWDQMTANEYKNRTECFRSQLSYYLDNVGETFQNFTALRELTSLSSAVNVTFAAYLNWLDYLNPYNDFDILKKETLPEMNFTNTQLFFITFAQLHCQNEQNNRTIDECCPLTVHTLARYSVNGPLMNSLEFAREFNCEIGSPMNVADKCIIY